MKKSRPGILLTCMCRCNDKKKMVSLLFKHTTTLGIRESISKRYTLTRTIKEHETPYGVVREKVSEGYGVCRGKLEYEDIAKIARENGMSLEEVKELVEKQRVNVKSKEELILALPCFLHCIDNHRDKKNQHPTSHGKKLLSCTYHNE